MVENKPHDETIDIWCLGILTYELLTGRAPFHVKDSEGGQVETARRITRLEYKFPENMSPGAVDLIQKVSMDGWKNYQFFGRGWSVKVKPHQLTGLP